MITLNAYTSGFHGQASTTGVETPRLVRWVYGEQDFDGITIFEDGWMYHPDADAVRSRVRVGWLVEPRALHPENYERAMDARGRFDYILTYDAQLLAADPAKFILCPRMGTHVPRQFWGIGAKTGHIGMMASAKATTPGHLLRHDAAARYGDSVDVYGIAGWADKIASLGPHRFAVVIECERAENLFTDHLLDAIALGCVPLYWGAPNIHEYLEPYGILQWETLDELGKWLTECSPALYHRMLPALRGNMARLPRYTLAEDWIAERFLGRLA